jgi:hypothetical protein
MKKPVACLLAFAVVALALPALADPPGSAGVASAHAGRPVIVVPGITIVGQKRVPIASIDVSRVPPTVQLAELKQPFLGRVDQPVHASPF